MRGLSRLYFYVRFFFEADTKEVRNRASVSAKEWCMPRNSHWTDIYRHEFKSYVRSYMFAYCDAVARSRLEGSKP